MNPIYNSIGKTYSATRAADPRIVDWLLELLDLPAGACILDVGAGTGNYSQAIAERGFSVTALEPSEVMRSQCKIHERLKWVAGVAEALPFSARSFDGLVMTLCVHHFSDWKKAFEEAVRVVGAGPIVILGFDPFYESGFWLFEYFPEFLKKDQRWFPRIDDIETYCETALTRSLECFPFPLPKDLEDRFAASAWAQPEAYLDKGFQAGISSFAVNAAESTKTGLEALERDMLSGEWEKKYGKFRSLEAFDAGYRFFRMKSSVSNPVEVP